MGDAFHTYGLLWTERGITTYIDSPDNVVLHVDFSSHGGSMWARSELAQTQPSRANPWKGRGASAPFDQKFFLLLNVAVGGTGMYFPDGLGGKPWSNKDEHAVNAFWNARGAWAPTWKGEKTAMAIDWIRVYQL